MTISTDLARVVHVGNGATTLFSFAGMEQVTADNVAVTLVATDGTEAPQVLGAGYTISPSGVTFAVAPADGVRVVIQRIEPLVQPDRYITNAPFPAAVTERRLDRMVMGLQQIADAADRGVRASIGDTADLLLPSAAARANLLLGFDAQGNVIAVPGPAVGNVLITPFGESLIAAADAPAARNVLAVGPELLFDTTLGAAASTFPVLSTITDNWPAYDIEVRGIAPTSSGANLHAQWSNDNGATWVTSDVSWMRWATSTASPGSVGSAGSASDTQIVVGTTFGNGSFLFTLLRGSGLRTLAWTGRLVNEAGNFVYVTGSAWGGGGGFNAIRFLFSAGNIAAGCRIHVRGRR